MLDLDDLRFFLAAARQGSLAAAAKDLHIAQSTVGRPLASLETSLLNRKPDGYVPMLVGQIVQEHAVWLEAEALCLERSIGGCDTRMAGLVCVTCAETVTDHILAQGLATLYQRHPEITVELIPDPRELSLSMREADISVRLKQTRQHGLVVRRIGTIAFGLYASSGYLERNGTPDFPDGCLDHHLVTQVEDIQDLTQTGWLTDLASHARVSMQTSSHTRPSGLAAGYYPILPLVRSRKVLGKTTDPSPDLREFSRPPTPLRP